MLCSNCAFNVNILCFMMLHIFKLFITPSDNVYQFLNFFYKIMFKQLLAYISAILMCLIVGSEQQIVT